MGEKAKEEHPPRDGPLKVLRLQPLVTGSAAAWARASACRRCLIRCPSSRCWRCIRSCTPSAASARSTRCTRAALLQRQSVGRRQAQDPCTPPPRAAEAEASAAVFAAGAAAGGSSVAGGGTAVPLPGGVRLSYHWQPGGGDGSRRAAIVVMPDPVTGMRLSARAASGGEAGWKWGSAADLNPERLLLDALRERSVRTLTSVAIKSLNSHAALEEGGPLPPFE